MKLSPIEERLVKILFESLIPISVERLWTRVWPDDLDPPQMGVVRQHIYYARKKIGPIHFIPGRGYMLSEQARETYHKYIVKGEEWILMWEKPFRR